MPTYVDRIPAVENLGDSAEGELELDRKVPRKAGGHGTRGGRVECLMS